MLKISYNIPTMPELPEVETIRRDLSKLILGKTIAKVILHKPKIVKSSAKEFVKILTGNKIKNFNRRGKLLIAELAKGGWILIHLKMTGQLIYRYGDKVISGGHPEAFSIDKLPNKYSHIILTFADKSQLFFNDMRQFGYMKLVDKKELDRVLSSYGIEPLTKNFTLPNFQKVLKNKTIAIKAVLLSQSHVSGIGNIYADETCFMAGILPSRRAHKLRLDEITRLHRACHVIIKKAVAKRGTTFRDYRDPSGDKGNYVKYLKVYGRGGEKCLRCKVNVLNKARVAGRGTVFCKKCQK